MPIKRYLPPSLDHGRTSRRGCLARRGAIATLLAWLLCLAAAPGSAQAASTFDRIMDRVQGTVTIQVVLEGRSNVQLPCDLNRLSVEIGQVLSKDLNDQGLLLLQVRLRDKYANLLKDGTVFVLHPETSPPTMSLEMLDEDVPTQVEPGMFIGFNPPVSYYLFKTQVKIRDTVERLRKMLGR